jgi:GNAT superfamily N-acetyltransferase
MINIRIATEQDCCSLPGIEKDAGTLFSDFGLEEISMADPSSENFYRDSPKGSVVLVATDGAAIVGFSVGMIVDDQAYLREVSVKRSHTRQGIGKRLVASVIQWAVEQEYSVLTLTTFRDLPFNGPFYEKFGFRVFEPNDRWPALREIREKEKRGGLEVRPRVAMRLELKNIKRCALPFSP